MNSHAFVPKQAISKDVDLYAEITANSTKDVAQKILGLIPPIEAHYKVLDNGCGAGEVTGEIMASKVLPMSIEAVDIDQPYLDRFSRVVAERKWPVHIANMSSHELDYLDGTFDLSIANFVVFITPGGGVPAVQEMRRTLRSGGTAVFTSWARLPHVDPVKAAHEATRDQNAPPLREIPAEWWLGSHLQRVAIEAGFGVEEIELHNPKVYIRVEDRQRLAQVLWSYLGPPVTGWLRSDEDTWDDAIRVILQKFDETQGFKRLDTGGYIIELTANVLVARK